MDNESVKKISTSLRLLLKPRIVRSGNKEYLYDKCRKKEVKATPEERVRQAVLNYFHLTKLVPVHNMRTEVSMKQYGYIGRNDRADILILRPDRNKVLAVIECKAAHITISEDVISQALRYAKALNSEYAFATNGKYLVSYAFDKKRGYVAVKCPGTYRKMCRSFENHLPQVQTVYERTDLKNLENIKYIRKHFYDYIGEATPNQMLPFIANLCDGLRDIHTHLEPHEYSGFSLIDDIGVKTLEIAVPGGGKFNNNNYRVFKVKDAAGQSFEIGMAVARYGSAKGDKTMLAIAVNDGIKCHHALQLVCDHNLIIEEENNNICYEIIHNGKINVGRKGSAKISEVLDYVKNNNPSLVGRDAKVHLAKFHSGELISVKSPDFVFLFERLVNYVLLLEKFREQKL
ncbi:MAG: type I restriction enzyme HsdR N-terminal domain-containing protein [Clostridiaceae bacterium]|nr:type I restriction enzyme HsdR N-terminal domain-containing protein [Clostridiaceae bacterium]